MQVLSKDHGTVLAYVQQLVAHENDSAKNPEPQPRPLDAAGMFEQQLKQHRDDIKRCAI
jgi:hypothetical protein